MKRSGPPDSVLLELIDDALNDGIWRFEKAESAHQKNFPFLADIE